MEIKKLVSMLVLSLVVTAAVATDDAAVDLPFAPPGSSPRHRLHAAAIGAIVLAAVVAVAAALVFIYLFFFRARKIAGDRGVRRADVELVAVARV